MNNSTKGYQKITTVILIVIIVVVAIVGGAYSYKKWILPAKNESPSSNEDGNQLIGGQKDEYGCLTPAGYSWCATKQKCLRIWEETCDSGQDENGIKQAFSKKYNKSIADISVNISQNDGNFATGAVTFGQGGPGEGGYFFAYKKDGIWIIAADGNGSVSCKYLKYYGFPDSMTKEACYDNQININFTKTGFLTSRDEQGGFESWALIYEETGKPTSFVSLIIRQDSFCDLGSGLQPCLGAKLIQDQKVRVEGDLQQGNLTVSSLTYTR